MDTMSLARVLCSLLLDSAAKGTVLLLVAWLAVELTRRSSAALRHSIWCMAMVGLLLSPVAAWLLPTWQIPILPPSPAAVAEARLPEPPRASVETEESPLIRTNSPLPGKARPFETPGPRVDRSMAEASSVVPSVIESPAVIQSIVEPDVRPLSTVEWVLLVVSVVWILGVTVFGGLLVVGLWRTICMRNRSVVIVDGEWPRMLTELRQRLGLSRSVELREHMDSVVPLTWGIWRPVVLVPQIAREWAEPMRRAVLLHELAHVQRGDVACQVLGRLTCVLYWFHPLSWFALRQLRQEREQACDDAVIHSGEKASDYAEQLLAVARLCMAPRGLSLGVAMAEGSSLERRVIALFDSARSHGPVRRNVAIALVAIGALAVGTISSMEPVASRAAVTAKAEEIAATPSELALLEKITSSPDGVASTEEIALLNPAFGEAKRGIQLGVAATSRKNVAVGERIPFRLYFRNIGEKEVTFEYQPNFMAYPPNVVNAKGEKIEISSMLTFMELATHTVTLKPGEVYGFLTYGLGLGKNQNAPSFEAPVADKYTLTFSEGIFWSLNDPAEKWSEGLHTGPLEFEIVPIGRKSVIARVLPNAQTEPHQTPKTLPIVRITGRAAQEQMELLKPVFGMVKLGIQLGLAIGSLERTFPEGGHIPLWLFYRNVGDKELTFQTTQDYMNDPVTVTDGNGNPVQVSFVMHWMDIAPLTITLKPGEVFCIATTGLNLGEPMPSIKPVAGKYKLTYPRGIWDVNTTPQLRTDIPVLPSLPPNLSPASPDAPPSPDTPVASPATPVGQMVETPNWSEQLDTGTIEFEIGPGKNGQPEARVLAMAEVVGDKEPVKPEYTLTGVVLDESNRPIAGALVDLWYEIPGKSAVTDEQGAFAIPGLTGTNSPVVMVTKDGHAPAIIERKPDHRVLAIRLCNDTWFEGKVTDADNQPVPDAVVRVSWEQGFKEGVMPFFVETKSQADGSYRLHLCPTGELLAGTEGVIEREGDVLDFRVSSPGRGVARHTHASIEKGAKVPLSFQLEPGIRFEARIVDSVSGEPVEGAVLYTADSPFIHARSDATGRVVFEDQFPATLQLFVGDGEGKAVPECTACDGALEFPSTRFGRWWSPDVATGDNYPPGHLIEPSGEEFPENFNQLFFELQPGMAPAKIFVERSATISGSVTDPEGKPVEGATVVPARNGSSLTGDTRFSIKTDKDGRYVMHIPASKNSTYNLLAHDGGHSEWRNWANGVAVPIQTMPGQTVENADLQLTRPGRVTGRILRKGQPVANYIVRTVASDRLEHSYYNPATKTNADGTFELSHVRPGKHYLQIGYYQYGKDGDQGQVIEVVAGEVVVDQLLEAKDQRDPDEGLVTPPEPEPTVADGAPTPAAKPPVDMAAEPIAEQPAPAGSKTISGQIINDLKLGIPNADVLIVAGGDLNDPREGTVIAQGKTDVLGNYSIAIPEAELGKRSWGQVWRRAPGFAATRGNTMQSLESLTEKPLQHNPLVSTEGLHLVVHDPAGKPLANARVEAISVKVNQGIGYTLPAAWRDDNSGVSDAEGRVHLPYIDPGSLNQLEITPEGSSAATRFSPNYFLNYRPEETAPHFIFPTYKTGTIEGQLVAGPGVTLPKDLKISLMTLTGKVDVAGVREVTVDEAGRFQIPDMPIGEISILKFLDDGQALRPWITQRTYVKDGETTKLEIPIVTGTRVTGRVQKSDTKSGVAEYEFDVYYGPAIQFRGSELWLMKQPVKADAEGRYELFLPPGPINLSLTRYVDGYSDSTSWLPRENRGTWGPLHEIPSQAEFELPTIDLVKMLPIQGQLMDQNDKPLAAYDWMVFGYPEIPGEREGFVMNSMAGVQTDKTGQFEGRYPETFPPVHWKARHRVWKTKYEFDDIKYAAKVVTRDPLVLQVDTTTPLEE